MWGGLGGCWGEEVTNCDRIMIEFSPKNTQGKGIFMP